MLIHLETSPLSVENFLFFFSFFFFLLLGGFKVLAKRAFQKSGDAFHRKSKERIQRSTTSRLSTLFLKQSRKEKKSRDERRHESVMDRERVKEETASRGDRERDRGRQERERKKREKKEKFRCFVQHSLFFCKLCVSSRHLPKRRRFCLFIPKSDT